MRRDVMVIGTVKVEGCGNTGVHLSTYWGRGQYPDPLFLSPVPVTSEPVPAALKRQFRNNNGESAINGIDLKIQRI